MRVKCVASVAPILFRGDRESVVQNLPINKDMREALLLGEWSTFIEYDHLDGTDPVIHFLKHVLFVFREELSRYCAKHVQYASVLRSIQRNCS